MVILTFTLMGLAMAITVCVLAVGLFNLTRGPQGDAKRANRLMRFRILAQVIAIILFMIGFFIQSIDS
ncbi:MAG: twin transmembrane helix small protein [Pseudomonadota bacterium]